MLPRIPERAVSDVTEAYAYCADCQEDRTFRLAALDVPSYDTADLNPVLSDVVNGEPVFRCPHCGRLEPDLVSGAGYDYELRDTGYEVGQWKDEEGADDEQGSPPIPLEWSAEDAMEPRGRGMRPDRVVAREVVGIPSAEDRREERDESVRRPER